MVQEKSEVASQSISTTMLQRVKAYDNDAWTRLVDLFTPFTYRWFSKRWEIPTKDIPDLVQNVFSSVSKGVKKFRKNAKNSTFRGWLWTIARNEANDYYRRRGPGQTTEEWLNQIPDEFEDDDCANGQALHRVLEMIRGDFTDKTFQVFWRFEFDGQDTKQIARDFGMKESSVREARRRVKSRLREECLELLGKGFWPFESE